MATRVIYNPFTPIPQSDKSHVRGWSMIWAQRLDAHIACKDDKLDNYDEIYIDSGVNFEGQLNLFGGISDELIERCEHLISCVKNGARLCTLDWYVKDLNLKNQLEKRLTANSSSIYFDQDFIDRLCDIFDNAKVLTMHDLKLPFSIIGDSHSIAYSVPTQKVVKQNGLTLHKVLTEGVTDFVKARISYNTKIVELCLGSIDIRHHAIRLGLDPKEFADEYARQVIKAQEYLKIIINVCAPVPVEFEGRRIPKTGYYKNKPFSGSRERRLDFTMEFISRLKDYEFDFNLISPPKTWYYMDGEQYAKEIMELSSSVHIAPKNYRSIRDWNV